ncbi:MAG: DNA topoisomerase I [Candidatus Aenigmarchaeota archaeon]|nr:DNA topoisomerase I [Candidatus Aenigmarchaeota archaeon]
MGHTLIICEKPTASKSIAEALSDGKPTKRGEEGSKASWYEFERDGHKFVSVPAVGHLFNLKQTGKGWDYPNFDVEWVPSFKASVAAAFSEPYFRNIEKLAKDAGDVVIATDYDDEGEVIGFNILRFILGRKDASRMRFSTMTKTELIESYLHAEKALNKNLIEAGMARHYLDWYYGINLTRALTNAIKKSAKRFRILSTGRVQGPTLHMLAKHERKIKAFKSAPFWEIALKVKKGKEELTAEYCKDKVWKEEEAAKIAKKAGSGAALVMSVEKKAMTQSPPKPYNTTSLLSDIYRYFGYSPQQGLSIAESLYQSGYISYPRTSSEKLPPDINYRKIITMISKQREYARDSAALLAKELKPVEGARSDSAHPAIYPSGETPVRAGDKQKKVYDLIVRRFLSCFGEPAKRESQKVVLDASGEKFILHGKRTIEAGWLAIYGKYAQREDAALPAMSKGDTLTVVKAESLAKETQPPARYSQGSVLKEMEEKSLGTKATRAQILQILYDRGYLIGKSIEVTELGQQLADILEKNVPDVVSEKLTKMFEGMMEDIELGKEKRENVLNEARKELEKLSASFKKKEEKIGDELTKAVIATQDRQSILGTCKQCGGTLKVHKLWRTGKRFVGCSGYKKGCRTGFPLPREGTIISTDKECGECKTPIIHVYAQGRRPFRMCLDINCITKKDWLDKNRLKQAKQESIAASKEAEKLRCTCGKGMKSQRALTMHRKKEGHQ